MPTPERGGEVNETRYEVRSIVLGGETVMAAFWSIGMAFDDCLERWAGRKAGSPVYAVRDTETEQRWSYADIKELRTPSGRARDGQ
jgi:hypothetical protein